MANELDQIRDQINSMTPAQRVEHEATIMAATAAMKFVPSPGPQTDAYHNLADILLYGGEAGGGKSGLILGLALTAHQRSLIMRRQYTDLSGLTEEAIKFNGTRNGFNGSIPPTLRTVDGRLIEFGAAQRPGDEENWMGRPHDFIGIDECWQMLETQVRFLMGWLRTTDPKQRTRVVLATNPPLSSEGEWLIKMFGPWLDPDHPNPAAQGELRWYIVNDEDEDVCVPGAGMWKLDGDEWRPATEEEIDMKNRGVNNGVLISMSRTFIRAKVRDNPFLANTDYAAKLDGLRLELRESLRDGNFMTSRKDDDWQVIKTSWVKAAQARWRPGLPEGIPMCALGADVSGGGKDPSVLAPRYDWYWPKLKEIPGKETPNGDGISGHILKHRTDNCIVGIDMGGGYGNLPYKELKKNEIEVYAHKGNEKSTAKSNDGLYGFANKRSEIYWRLAEALDPNQQGGSQLALPPDALLLADLCAPRYTKKTQGGREVIEVEPKEDVVARLGRSPDRGDAVTISWAIGKKGMNYQGGWKAKNSSSVLPKVNMGHTMQRRHR